MRSTTTASGVVISYPEELAHTFNTLPIKVSNVPDGTDVTVTVGDYSDTRTPYNNVVTFDISEFVALIFAADLNGAQNLYASAGTLTLTEERYSYPGATPATGTKAFGLSPYFKSVAFSVVVGAESFNGSFTAIWGAVAYDSMLGQDYTRARMSSDYSGDIEVVVVKGGAAVSLYGADGLYLKKYTVPAGDEFVALVIPIASMRVTRIEATLAAAWNMARLDSPTTRTQIITFDKCHEADKESICPVFFIDREGLSRTIPAKIVERSYTSEAVDDITRAEASAFPDTGYNQSSPLHKRRNIAYNSAERLKLSTQIRNAEELAIYRQVVSSPIVYIGLASDTVTPRRRVYPVPATVALPTSKDLQGFVFELEVPTPAGQRL